MRLAPGFGIGFPKKKPSGSDSDSEDDEQVGHQVSSCSSTDSLSGSPPGMSIINTDELEALERQLLN